MTKLVYLAQLEPEDVPALAFIAGLLQGQGVPQGAILQRVIEDVQVVEVPDDFGEFDQTEEADDSLLIAGEPDETPDEVLDEVLEDSSELPPIDPAADPTSPEFLGIQLNLDPPPPPPGPMNRQEDFGAGPPPREG